MMHKRIILLSVVGIALSSFFIPCVVAQEAPSDYKDGWKFYKKVGIEGTVQDNQTIKVEVSRDPEMNPGYSDIRFLENKAISVDQSSYIRENSLPYWIEEKNEKRAIVWVKRNASDGKIYIYFGNKNASSRSNGYETFLFFENFSSSKSLSNSWYSTNKDDVMTTSVFGITVHIPFVFREIPLLDRIYHYFTYDTHTNVTFKNINSLKLSLKGDTAHGDASFQTKEKVWSEGEVLMGRIKFGPLESSKYNNNGFGGVDVGGRYTGSSVNHVTIYQSQDDYREKLRYGASDGSNVNEPGHYLHGNISKNYEGYLKVEIIRDSNKTIYRINENETVETSMTNPNDMMVKFGLCHSLNIRGDWVAIREYKRQNPLIKVSNESIKIKNTSSNNSHIPG